MGWINDAAGRLHKARHEKIWRQVEHDMRVTKGAASVTSDSNAHVAMTHPTADRRADTEAEMLSGKKRGRGHHVEPEERDEDELGREYAFKTAARKEKWLAMPRN
jgi:hypothetical protein